VTKKIAYVVSPGADPVPGHVVSPGFEAGVVPSIGAPFPADPVHHMLTELSTVEAAMRAERLGYDGVLVGAVADYGIVQIRSAIRIPAIGSGQASMLAAAALGRRFGIVTIWPRSQRSAYQALLRDYGLRDHCTGIRYVSTDSELATLADEDNFYTRTRAGRQDMVDRISREIDHAVADGAEAIVLGCNCMTPVAGVLAGQAEVPVIDPTTTGYRMMELMVALGLSPSPVAYPAATDRAELFSAMVGIVDDVLSADGAVECEVCVLSDDGTASCTAERE
jgi:Asp/Glu/hydantoin racemase